MRVNYNPKLKELARKLRNNSTKSERKLWQCLKDKQMMGYDFHRQKPIGNFIADFFSNELKLAIELDGCTHNFEGVPKKDKLKEDTLKGLGITVLRFRDKDVMLNTDGVLRAIRRYIEEHTP